jgi:hypothetical protein
MKAEHYIKSGLNGIPTSVMRLSECISLAAGEWTIDAPPAVVQPASFRTKKGQMARAGKGKADAQPSMNGFTTTGRGLPSQADFTVTGEALVTDAPITFLGYVNRATGVIEEEGHPANGQSLAGKIAISPVEPAPVSRPTCCLNSIIAVSGLSPS